MAWLRLAGRARKMSAGVYFLAMVFQSVGFDQAGLRQGFLLSGIHDQRSLVSRLKGAAPMPKLSYTDRETHPMWQLFAMMLQRGYFIHPTHPWFISYAHDDACIDRTLEDIDAAAANVAGTLVP